MKSAYELFQDYVVSIAAHGVSRNYQNGIAAIELVAASNTFYVVGPTTRIDWKTFTEKFERVFPGWHSEKDLFVCRKNRHIVMMAWHGDSVMDSFGQMYCMMDNNSTWHLTNRAVKDLFNEISTSDNLP